MRVAFFLAAFSAGVSFADSETIGLASRGENVWLVQPVTNALAAPVDAQWRFSDGLGFVGRTEVNVKKGLHPLSQKDIEAHDGVWKKRKVFVPKSWAGGSVVFSQHLLHEEDLLLWVNGEKAGEVLRPAGEIDVTQWIRAGETNSILIYLSRSGEGTSRGRTTVPHWHHPWGFGPFASCRLTMSRGPRITDVFANTSWREKRLRLEVEVEEKVQGQRSEVKQWNVSVSVSDQDGKVVKSVSSPVSRLMSLPASSPNAKCFAIDIPWDDPITWELGRPYLYTANVRIESSATSPLRHSATLSPEREVRFGFREIWRDGKELYMNGHPLHFRPCYSYGANAVGARFLQSVGYNVLTCNHNISAFGGQVSDSLWDWLDTSGMGIVLNPGSFATICDYSWEGLGNFATNAVQQGIYRGFIRDWHRRTRNHPSLFACYVSQMIICDIHNFHPGVIAQQDTSKRNPDAPGKPQAIERAREINRLYNPNVLYYSHADGSNGDLSSGNLYLNWTPLQEREEWLSKWAERGTYPWHSAEFGQPYDGSWYNCGGEMGVTKYAAVYFGDQAYAWEPMSYLTNSVRAAKENKSGHGSPLGARISALHPGYWELQRLWTRNTNRAWRGYGQGGGNIYFNLTAAYGKTPSGGGYGGMTEAEFESRAQWVNEGYSIYAQANQDLCCFIGGSPCHTDKTHAYFAGEKIVKQLVLIWDGVGERMVSVRVWVEGEEGKSVFEKKFDVSLRQGEIRKIPFEFTAPEVKEKTVCQVVATFDGAPRDSFDVEVYPHATKANHPEVSLFDPTGAGARFLQGLGVAYRKVDSTYESGDRLVIGPYALEESVLEVAPEELLKGRKVLVLNQSPRVWESLGFRVVDTVSRIYFTHFEDLGFANDALRHWRGSPRSLGGRTNGALMGHQAGRGPRWTYTHALSLFSLQIPDKVGFEPLVEGEFDMGYSPALRLKYGKGSVTFSSFEFEDRVPDDPAALATAQALMRAAFADEGGKRTGMDESDLRSAVTRALNLPKDEPVYRRPVPDEPLFVHMGPSLLRWPVPITNEVPASSSRFWSRIRTNAGIEADKRTVSRVLTQFGKGDFESLPVVNVMGPYNLSEKSRRGGSALDVRFDPVEGMALAGDGNPNEDFPLPQGGTANWRPTLLADADGKFDLARLFATNGCQMAYSFCTVERQTSGPALMKLGFDWSGRVWVNGQEVFRTTCGALFPQFEISVDLKQGRNVIAFKTLSDSFGRHAFWAVLERATKDGLQKPTAEVLEHNLYEEPLWKSDPWTYFYW